MVQGSAGGESVEGSTWESMVALGAVRYGGLRIPVGSWFGRRSIDAWVALARAHVRDVLRADVHLIRPMHRRQSRRDRGLYGGQDQRRGCVGWWWVFPPP